MKITGEMKLFRGCIPMPFTPSQSRRTHSNKQQQETEEENEKEEQNKRM
jgi:hypothetical protein